MIHVKQKLVHVWLLVLLLALMLAPVAGAAVASHVADDSIHSTLFEVKRTGSAPAAVIACNGGGSSGGSCGGG